jgi:HSP20 family protein
VVKHWPTTPPQVAVDLVETAESLVLYADLPGASPETVQVVVQEGNVFLSGRSSLANSPPNGTNHLAERDGGHFYRRIPLPVPVQEPAAAELRNGVLRLTLPKATAAHSRNIPVRRA